MSDNEYEKFEISDYDLQNEFNINRPRKKYTKHQQIYGIWADDSEDEGGAELSSRRSGRVSQKSKDYTAPVSFVAGGVQQAGKKDEDNEKQQEDDSQITDEDEDGRPSFGRNAIEIGTSSESEAESRPEKTEIAGLRTAPSTSSGLTKGVGQWEQHTRGIGAKLLLQMGYQPGKGLGKDLQGISQPVEATMRKGRGAIGAYGPEKPAKVGGHQKSQPAIDQDEKETKEFEEKLKMWRKDGKTEKSKKSRYYYRSVEEIIEKGKKSTISDQLRKHSKVTVIDMTGPEKRVLSGYHALGQAKIVDEDTSYERESKKCTNFALPELMHNLNLIVDMCEQDIIAVDKQEREAIDRQNQLEQQRDNLEKIVQLENDHIRTIEKALHLVEQLTQPVSGQLTLDKAERIFVTLQTDFTNEYREFGLGDLAGGVIAPLVNAELVDWNPLEEPTSFIDRIKKWKSILDTPQSEVRNVFDPYSSLVWAGVIPKFRSAASHWNPKSHQKMAALLDAWAPLFPSWILDSVLEQIILPRLISEVQNWDPLTDTMPIHVWILPWSKILGHKMEDFIYPTIRDKLGNALQAWTPQDRSARAMLTPWKNAFDDGELHSFLLKHILPKLQLTLNELVINPASQDLEHFNQVWEWNEVTPTLLMAQLLDKFFFPKWLQTLVIWLNQSPNFEQISRWYSGWKSLLSDEICEQPAIKEHFRRALEIMQRAAGIPVTAVPESSTSDGLKPPALMDLQIPPPVQLEFKELVSQKCAERGIIFAPMPGRREFGKQVYRAGKLFCYIDRNVLMISDGTLTNWVPTSIGLMLERAATGVTT